MLREASLISHLINILNIPSPTYREKQKLRFVKRKFREKSIKSKIEFTFYEEKESLIVVPKIPKLTNQSKYKNQFKRLNHFSLVGHLDVVPQHVKPHIKSGRIYGAGASDMQGSLAVFLYLLDDLELFLKKQLISFVFYAREEMTPLVENGLYSLIQKFPKYFKSINLAIVAEPTDNQIHLGCLGSIHAEVVIKGMACHSARPWQGENALYKALPFIKAISKIKPKPVKIHGVTFKDVIQITESETTRGSTSLPAEWRANLNYRYAPNTDKRSDKMAITEFKNILKDAGVSMKNIKIKSHTPAGAIFGSPLLDKFLKDSKCSLMAKQAWTDVAQFSHLKIPAFNYGPGLTKKCHTNDEYIVKKDIEQYTKNLTRLLIQS